MANLLTVITNNQVLHRDTFLWRELTKQNRVDTTSIITTHSHYSALSCKHFITLNEGVIMVITFAQGCYCLSICRI